MGGKDTGCLVDKCRGNRRDCWCRAASQGTEAAKSIPAAAVLVGVPTMAKWLTATGVRVPPGSVIAGQRRAAAVRLVDVISPTVTASSISGAVSLAAGALVNRVSEAARGRGGVAVLAGTEQPVAARIAVAGDKEILVLVPNTPAVSRGDGRPEGLAEQPCLSRWGRQGKDRQRQKDACQVTVFHRAGFHRSELIAVGSGANPKKGYHRHGA